MSILLVRSMSQVLPRYKGRGNQEDTNSRERESPRTILEPALINAVAENTLSFSISWVCLVSPN